MDAADLLSNAGGYGLTEEEKKRALKYGLLNMGVGILANNYGNYGAFAPAIGRGAQQGLLGYQAQIGREEQGAQQRAQRAAQQKLFQDSQQGGQIDPQQFRNLALQYPEAGYADMAAKAMFANGPTDSPYGKIMPSDFTPESLAQYDTSRKFSDLVRNNNSTYGKYNPGQYTPDSWANFVQSGDPNVLERYAVPKVVNAGGTQEIMNLSGKTPKNLGSIPVTPKVTETPAYQAAQESAKAGAKISSEASAKAAVDLPKVESNAVFVKSLVKDLINHPGFQSTVGATLTPGMRFIPGTPESDFMNRLGQLKGSAFLTAFDTLKGGGQITEVEGAKATAAINRMDISTSEPEFKAAAKDFLDVVDAAEKRAKKLAGNNATPEEQQIIQDGKAKGLSDKAIVKKLNKSVKELPTKVPVGLSADEWKYMSPEDRALWMK